MRVVVDTNVIVSGLICSRGAPARIVDAILDHQVIPVLLKITVKYEKGVGFEPDP